MQPEKKGVRDERLGHACKEKQDKISRRAKREARKVLEGKKTARIKCPILLVYCPPV